MPITKSKTPIPSQSGHKVTKMSKRTCPAWPTAVCTEAYMVAQGMPSAVKMAVVVEVMFMMLF